MPPAAPASVQSFCNLLAKSKLLPPDEVKSAYRRWQDETRGGSDDVEAFRKHLVARKLLTEYQAVMLMRGHWEGFFLDQYKVLDRVGKGRMAGVYKAQHPSGQVVAIKVLPPSKAKDPQLLARFHREARLLTQLQHPNIVRAFQVGESGGKHYFVMECLEGETLDDVLQRRKRLPPAEAVRIVHQALLGLQRIHEKGLVHRDLKPANLMLVPAPAPGGPDTTLHATVKVLDIGLGRAVFDENAPTEEEATQLTGEGAILGTPDYMAPEQGRNARAVDVRADIYSLGCVLYHTLTGQPPFPDKNIISQMVRHANEPARPLTDFLTQVPDGLQQVVNWMMAKDPSQRYPTPERAAQALQIFLMSLPESAPETASGAPLPAYVQWLQDAGHADAPKPTPLPPPAPASAPAPAVEIPTGRLEEAPRRKERPRDREARREERRRSRDSERKPRRDRTAEAAPLDAAAPLPAPAPLREEDFDVELVSVPPTREGGEERPRALTDLSRRDFLMLGIGGGGVLAAILCGYGIAQLMRRKDPPAPQPSPPAEQPEPPAPSE